MMDVIELAQALICFDTVNPPGHEEPCARFLGSMLEQEGAAVTYHSFAPGRTSVVANFGRPDRGRPICFTGHIDTVPFGTNPWKVSPLSGAVVDGRLYGRGASDMKAGIAAMVVAAIDLRDVLADSCGVTLVLTAGEETGCEGARHLVASNALMKAGAIVVGEPTENEVVLGHKGAMWLKASTTGKTAHGSMPERGDNAIYKLAEPVLRLRNLAAGDTVHPVMGRTTLNLGTIAGGRNVNSVPDQASAEIDVRIVPGDDREAVYARLCNCLGPNVTLTRLMDVDSTFTDPHDPWVRGVYSLVQRFHNKPLTVRTVPFFSDGSALSQAMGDVPTVILGPGESSLAHQTDEFCRVDRLKTAYAIYRELMHEWSRAERAADV